MPLSESLDVDAATEADTARNLRPDALPRPLLSADPPAWPATGNDPTQPIRRLTTRGDTDARWTSSHTSWLLRSLTGGRGRACCFPSFLAHPLLFLAISSTKRRRRCTSKGALARPRLSTFFDLYRERRGRSPASLCCMVCCLAEQEVVGVEVHLAELDVL
jgi:hypothetical protein